MAPAEKTEEDVNEDFWISLEGIISPINRVARATDCDEITPPAPVGRIREQDVRKVKDEVESMARELDATQARELRSYVADLEQLIDEVKQFNSNTKVYMKNVNYDGGVEDLL